MAITANLQYIFISPPKVPEGQEIGILVRQGSNKESSYLVVEHDYETKHLFRQFEDEDRRNDHPFHAHCGLLVMVSADWG